MGRRIDRTQRELSDEEVARIAGTYHAWRGDEGAGRYEDTAGFCKSATLEELRAQQHVLTPGRYVGAEEADDEEEPFEVRFSRLVEKLEAQFAEGSELEKRILEGLGRISSP
jgi:type I restriction enzyme M protein